MISDVPYICANPFICHRPPTKSRQHYSNHNSRTTRLIKTYPDNPDSVPYTFPFTNCYVVVLRSILDPAFMPWRVRFAPLFRDVSFVMIALYFAEIHIAFADSRTLDPEAQLSRDVATQNADPVALWTFHRCSGPTPSLLRPSTRCR